MLVNVCSSLEECLCDFSLLEFEFEFAFEFEVFSFGIFFGGASESLSSFFFAGFSLGPNLLLLGLATAFG